jgi:serine/threonine protein kinase
MDPQLESVTLAQRLAAGPIEPRKALDILEQLLSGLVVAHDSGLLHGSISPQKIILTPDGRATLIGFPGRDAAAQPLARYAAGAPEQAYVSPEQIVDDPVGRRTDIYSLGVVGYTMLVGKDPFGVSEGVATDNVFYRILYMPAPQAPASAPYRSTRRRGQPAAAVTVGRVGLRQGAAHEGAARGSS